jgi:phosphatidylinositol alpha-1,6-mannosyltransferase
MEDGIIGSSTERSHERRALLMLTELFLPTKGGTAVWFDEVYRRLGGKEIHVVTADVPGAAQHDRDHPNSVHRVRLQRHRWLRPESLAMYLKLLARSLALHARHRFAAVHAGRVLPEGLVGLVIARLARLPLVVYAHGEEITGWRKAGKFRAKVYVYRHADSIIANSDFSRTELLKLGIRPERISLIQPGVDVERFRPGLPHDDLRAALGLGAGCKLILSVGRLSRRKGFDQTIRALAQLRAQGLDVAYAVVGTGPDRDYLESIARQCGVQPWVHLLGHVQPDDLPRWYCAADVFAMPNRAIGGDTEGFGMVFIEAAACGKAVVAGRDGGTADAVLDGTTGYRVDGESVAEIAEALRLLLSHPDVARGMGSRGHARVQAEFSWERVAQKTSALDQAHATRHAG